MTVTTTIDWTSRSGADLSARPTWADGREKPERIPFADVLHATVNGMHEIFLS
jgi:hypothetical protein